MPTTNTNDATIYMPSGEALRAGTRVQLCGLKSKPELNGCVGTILGPEAAATGRYPVRVNLAPARDMSIKPENVQAILCDRTFAPLGDATRLDPVALLDPDSLATLTGSFHAVTDWCSWRAASHKLCEQACPLESILGQLALPELSDALRLLFAGQKHESLADGIFDALRKLQPSLDIFTRVPDDRRRAFERAGIRSLAREVLLSAEVPRKAKTAACIVLMFMQGQDDAGDDFSTATERLSEDGHFRLNIDEFAPKDEYSTHEVMLDLPHWRFPEDATREDREQRLDLDAVLTALRADDVSISSYILHYLAASVEGSSILAFSRKSLLVKEHDFGFGLAMSDPKLRHDVVPPPDATTCALELVLSRVLTDEAPVDEETAVALVRLIHAVLSDASFVHREDDPLWSRLGPMRSSHLFSLSMLRRNLMSNLGAWRLLADAIAAHPADVYIVCTAGKAVSILSEGEQDEQPRTVGFGDRGATTRQRMTTAAESGIVRAVLSALSHDCIRDDAVGCSNLLHMLLKFVGNDCMSRSSIDYGGSFPGGSDPAFLASIAEAASELETYSVVATLLQACPMDSKNATRSMLGWLQVCAATTLLWLLTAPCFEWSVEGRKLAREAGLDVSLISAMTAYHSDSEDGLKTYLIPPGLLRLSLSAFIDKETSKAALAAAGAWKSWLEPLAARTTGLALLRQTLASAR